MHEHELDDARDAVPLRQRLKVAVKEERKNEGLPLRKLQRSVHVGDVGVISDAIEPPKHLRATTLQRHVVTGNARELNLQQWWEPDLQGGAGSFVPAFIRQERARAPL